MGRASSRPSDSPHAHAILNLFLCVGARKCARDQSQSELLLGKCHASQLLSHRLKRWLWRGLARECMFMY